MTKKFAWIPTKIIDMNNKEPVTIWFKSYYKMLDRDKQGWKWTLFLPLKP